MSDIRPSRTLDTLLRSGVFVNDYPGLVLDGKDISYFSLRFPEGEVAAEVSTGEKRGGNGDRKIDKYLSVVERYNVERSVEGTERELKVFYLDDQGYCLAGRVEDEKEELAIKFGNREVRADRVFQVNLIRQFSAEGLGGLYRIRFSEVKNVYDGMQKFLASYMNGWLGLFRQYETVKERTEIFRRFKPFKFPIFGSRETLKRAVFRMQIGIRSPNGDEGFKWISTDYGKIELQDALAV